jgi:hypothetical protein
MKHISPQVAIHLNNHPNHKNTMKIKKYIMTGILATGALLLASSAHLQALPNLTIAEFATGTQGENSVQDGTYGQYVGDCLQVPYGVGTIGWDGTQFAPGLNNLGAANTGSAYLNTIFNNSGNNWLIATVAPGYNNWYNASGNGVAGWSTGTADFTQYTAVQFDILWDNTSTLSIDQYNTGTGWNPAWLYDGNTSGASTGYYNQGIQIMAINGHGVQTYLGNVLIPDSAASGWQTVTMPYSDTLAGIGASAGLWFNKQGGGYGDIQTQVNGAFWIDNVILLAPVVVAPPPTMTPPVTAIPGLNIFNATEGNSFYDRNEVVATTTSGLSWVGNPGATYSFTLTGFPKVPVGSYSGEAYMFLVPNATAEDNAPDYNETNCLVLEIQTPDNVKGGASVSYKVNAPKGEPPGSNQLVDVTSSKLLGTYSITFTDNDDGYITTPDGTKGNFSLPAGTGATYFAETGNQPYNFLVYLGGQANQATAINQATVYGSFSALNVPSASSLNETFTSESSLVNWTAGPTSEAAADVLVPSSALYWISWTLPATGFALNASASLSPPNWQSVTTYNPVPLYQTVSQLIGPSDLQSPTNDQYFTLVKRVYSPQSGSLLIAFPGQTFVNGTGVTGTPTPIEGEGNWAPNGPVYVYAVDSGNHLVTSVTDGISLFNGGPDADPISGDFASESGGSLAGNMVGGIATFNTTFDNSFSWGNAGLTAPATVTIQVIDYTLQPGDQNTFNSSPISLVNQPAD